jgi:hypothetical protein
MTKPSTPTIPPTQEEKLAALLNDQKLRKANRRDDTFQSRAVADFDIPLGRFTERERATVVGSEGAPNYPSASPPLQNDPVPDEPALGFSVEAQEPCGEAFEVAKSLASTSTHSPDADAEEGDAVEPETRSRIASPTDLAELDDDPVNLVGASPPAPTRTAGSSSSPTLAEATVNASGSSILTRDAEAPSYSADVELASAKPQPKLKLKWESDGQLVTPKATRLPEPKPNWLLHSPARSSW